MLLQIQSTLALFALPAIACLLCERRDLLRFWPSVRLVAAGLAVQFAIAGALLNIEALRTGFAYPAAAVDALQFAMKSGMHLVFGHLAGAPAPYEVKFPQNGFVLALEALPMVLLISVISKLLYHWGILQIVVRTFAHGLERTLAVKGAVGTGAAANIFLGMVEAPLVVKPYLATMSRAGLFATMTVGMAGVAGTVLTVYSIILKPVLPDAAGHLIVASVISVPAALVVAALMVPESAPATASTIAVGPDDTGRADAPRSTMDAIAQGTREGVDLLVNIAALLVVAVALVSLVNLMLSAVLRPLGIDARLELIAGYFFMPLAFLIGIPWAECTTAGTLLGIKTILNEFLAYLQLAALPEGQLSPRSRLLMTYALCGFANFGSLGIMIGGLVAMAPGRRTDILELGPRTILAGTLATLMTAAVVGVLTAPG